MNSDDIQNIFFVECEESLEAAEAGLDACKAGTQDEETINAIFRAVHSIKGGAGAFGYSALQAFTHCFETLLADVREGTVPLTAELVNELLVALDCLRDHVDAARSGAPAPDDVAIMRSLTEAHEATQKSAPKDTGEAEDGDLDALLDDLLATTQETEATDDAADEVADKTHWLVHIRPHSGSMDNGGEPMLWLRELTELGGVCIACDQSAVPPLHEFEVGRGYLGWTFRMPEAVEHDTVTDIFSFAADDCSIVLGDDETIPPVADVDQPTATGEGAKSPIETQKKDDPSKAVSTPNQAAAGPRPASPSAPPATAASQSIRIDLSKLDKLIDGVGELVIAQAMLAQRLTNEDLAHIEELALLDNLVRGVQEHAMAFRAQPIGSVFSRVPRLLRELAASTGKHVKLEVNGEHTELDKTVIERLSEPLTHLIRNAVDHGIEDAEERRAAGKDPEGTLTLSAEQKAGRILIRIADDGRGISAEKVRAKAIANGIISEDAHLNEDEINNLIFAPGFSTAVEVSSVSGRGVGMDVVRQNVKELSGRITIESTPGQGTEFIMALPLTLAISDGMIVQTGEQSFVVPLAHVVESLRPDPSNLKGLGSSRQMLNVRGQFVPVVPIADLTSSVARTYNPCEGVLVIVETERFGQAALLVDAITDQRQFVIKSLDAHYKSVEGVAGATILGDGRVALIVDVDHLVEFAGATGELQAVA